MEHTSRALALRAGMCALLILCLCAHRPVSGAAPDGVVMLQVNPFTAQQGGYESILVTAAPSSAMSLTVASTTTLPTTATVYSGFDTLAALAVTGTLGAGVEGFSFPTGPDGRAILTFPIPSTAQFGTASVQASDGQGNTAASGFSVAAPISGTFPGSVFLAMPHVLVRTPELPPRQGSVAHERIRVITAPGAVISTTAFISGTASALGSADDGGTAYVSGSQFFADTQTADANGSILVRVPLSAALLRPGRGARVLLHVDSSSGGLTTEYRTSLALRESGLRLLAHVTSTTRGGRRPIFELGRLPTGFSTLHVAVIANQGAHISAQASFTAHTTLTATATAGAGTRAMLSFSAPNSYAPPPGFTLRGTVHITSAFRGAMIARDIAFTYGRRRS